MSSAPTPLPENHSPTPTESPGPVSTSTTDSSIADLQAKWDELTDLNRVRAVAALHATGISYRKLGPKLGCCESHVRYLAGLLAADPHDIRLAEQGLISTKDLSRRAANKKRHEVKAQTEAGQRERNEKAIAGAQAILKWLASNPASAGNAEQIIEEAAVQLRFVEQSQGIQTSSPRMNHLKLGEIICLCRPSESDCEMDVEWYADWLITWAFHAFPENAVLWDGLRRAHT